MKSALTAAVASGAVNIALDRDTLTAINTMLNFASWWILIQQQRKLRHDVAPKLDHIEDAATAVAAQLETRVPGGRRQHDQCTDDDDSASR